MEKHIVVAGSLNMDLVVAVPRQPKPGETILGRDVETFPGGKGANQAAAAAKAGGNVVMLGMVGKDTFGEELKANLKACGVDTSYLGVYDGPSGMAFITVDQEGENMIVVSPGANGTLTDIPEEALSSAALVLMQLEIPLETVARIAKKASEKCVPVMLNPAPAQPLGNKLLETLTYLIANESEASLLTGLTFDPSDGASVLEAARRIKEHGVKTVVITLGEAGLVWSGADSEGYLPAYKARAVDTTAAGDAFCGALAARLAQGVELEAALRFASAAGAIAVTRKGAQPSLPALEEIEAMMKAQ